MDKQQIIGSVRVGDTVYQRGQEKELAAVLTADQVTRLTEEGVIAGFSKKAKPESEESSEQAPPSDGEEGNKAASANKNKNKAKE